MANLSEEDQQLLNNLNGNTNSTIEPGKGSTQSSEVIAGGTQIPSTCELAATKILSKVMQAPQCKSFKLEKLPHEGQIYFAKRMNEFKDYLTTFLEQADQEKVISKEDVQTYFSRYKKKNGQ